MALTREEQEANLGLSPDEFEDMINSGSALPDFGALGNENTASLGLNKPMSVISASMDKVLDDLSHNDHPHLDTIQFVTAKMYDINSMLTKNAFRLTGVSRSLREMEGIALTMKPRHLGGNNYGPTTGIVHNQYTFASGITGSLQGNVDGTANRATLADGATKVSVGNSTSISNFMPIVGTSDASPDGGQESLFAGTKVRMRQDLGYVYANKFVGENDSHLGYTSSVFITPDQFAEVANSQRRQLSMDISGSYVSTSHDSLHFVTNFQLPKGFAPSKVQLAINNPHPGKEVKVFANKYFNGTTGAQLYSGTTVQTTSALQDISLTKQIVGSIGIAAQQDDPFYFTLMVGPLSAGDQIFGARINYGPTF